MPMTVTNASDLDRTLKLSSSADLRQLLKTTIGEERQAIVDELNRRIEEDTPRRARFVHRWKDSNGEEITQEFTETINPCLYE